MARKAFQYREKICYTCAKNLPMPKPYLLIVALVLPVCVFCQSNNVPIFGKIDKAELERTTCSFDKDAEAEVIADVGEFSLEIFSQRAVRVLHNFVRIKILSDKGLDYISGQVAAFPIITIDYQRTFYTTAEYPVLKEFYKKTYSLLDEQFVIKKKAYSYVENSYRNNHC